MMHAHKCRQCGTLFYHSNEMAGNVAAHKCPGCGGVEWDQFTPASAQLPRFAPARVATATDFHRVAIDILEVTTWVFIAAAAGFLFYRAVKMAGEVQQ